MTILKLYCHFRKYVQSHTNIFRAYQIESESYKRSKYQTDDHSDNFFHPKLLI